MPQAPNILYIVLPEGERTAGLRRAVELARRTKGRLHLCSFVHDGLIGAATVRSNADIAYRARRGFVSEHMDKLRTLAMELADGRFEVECEAIWAPVPHEAILTKAIEIGADYVVKNVHHEPAIRRVFFSPLDFRLARLLPCALMLVGPNAPACPERILAAVDVLADDGVSDESLNSRVMQVATAVAEYTDARLDLVSVAPYLPMNPRSAIYTTAAYDETIIKHVKAFHAFVDRHQIPNDRCHRLVGLPAQCISDLVERHKVDMVVVGNIYRNAWERMLLGSTTEALAQDLPCDLLVVKQRQFFDTLAQHLDLARVGAEVRREQPDLMRGELA